MGIVEELISARRDHGERGSRLNTVSDVVAECVARVPLREERHHIGASRDLHDREVTRVEFQTTDVDAAVRGLVAGPAHLGDHLPVQAGSQETKPVGGCENLCRAGDVVAIGDEVKPSALPGCPSV